ncbi:MAG: cyclic nucleotide-binding domain-containing protein [Gaiellaceae bacterium]
MHPAPEQLVDSPLFASLTDEQLRAVASLMDVVTQPAGTTLVGEGAPGFSVFVLLDGAAEATAEDLPLSTLRAGDYFGEIALLNEARRTATVTATSPVTLAVMYGSDFRVFERDFPNAAQQMKETTARRLERSGSPE